MSSTRVFLLSPALARLIERDRAGERVRQGYFPEQPDRSTHVQVTGDAGHLILVSHSARGPVEDAAEISLPQAEALLALTAGQVEYLSVAIDVGSHVATIQRFVTSAPFDLISLVFRDDKTVRSSIGVGLVWDSPFGPMRFDYSFPLSKQPYDKVQEFRFGGGTKF